VVRFVTSIATQCPCALVIDADALNCLVGGPERLGSESVAVVLTPHPGEAARLLHCTVAEVQSDRPGAAAALASRYRGVVVLKGHQTIVTDGTACYRNHTGNPGMATGGTGDVLTGLIGGLLAQGMPAMDAAILGVFLHGRAGDLAAAKLSEQALTAGDVLEHIGPAFLTRPG
jgi:NAD(P)H-hydrate epimerase